MSPLSYTTIEQAKLELNKDSLYSPIFADIYHDPNVLEEVDFVFHQGNQLLERWQQNQQAEQFTIGETGFGVGLNFLVTCQAWRRCQLKPKHLNFISTEQWLISPEQFKTFYSDKPTFRVFVKSLQQALSNRRVGFHHIEIANDISLYLLLGDATDCLKQLTAVVDAWFLDGFSPAKNPKMWSLPLFKQLARLSKTGSTVATYTAASQVRSNLQSAGFTVSKTAGFGGKRHRLIAQIDELSDIIIKGGKSWHVTPPANPQLKSQFKVQSKDQTQALTVIGGGIAGLTVINAAKKMGFYTTLIDSQPQSTNSILHVGASGNPYALVMPYLTARSSAEALFYWRAFDYAKTFYQESGYNPIGVTDLNKDKLFPIETFAALPDDLITLRNGFTHYPSAGYVNNHILSEELKGAIDDFQCASVDSIQYDDQKNQWEILNKQGECIHRCSTLVVATGIYSLKLLPELSGHLRARWGQTSLLTGTHIAKNQLSATLAKGYCIPVHKKQGSDEVLLGSDYQHLPASDWFKPAQNKHQSNVNNRNKWLHYDGFDFVKSASLKADNAGIRATTSDHLPVCGPMIDNIQFKKDYCDLHHGRHWQVYPEAKVQPNLYTLTGLGSRGFTTAPLLANYLMTMISGRPLPLELDLGKIVHPNRFLYRQLKKPPL